MSEIILLLGLGETPVNVLMEALPPLFKAKVVWTSVSKQSLQFIPQTKKNGSCIILKKL